MARGRNWSFGCKSPEGRDSITSSFVEIEQLVSFKTDSLLLYFNSLLINHFLIVCLCFSLYIHIYL